MNCPKCNTFLKKQMIRESITKNSGGKYMIRGECMMCDSWIKWMPYADSLLVERLIAQEYERTCYDTK